VFAGGVKLSGASGGSSLPECARRFVARCMHMARRNFCLVPAYWTAREVQSHRCDDGSHGHITLRERNELLAAQVADWLAFPRVLRLKRTVPLRGLSCKVGEYLASQATSGRAWARVMLAEVLH